MGPRPLNPTLPAAISPSQWVCWLWIFIRVPRKSHVCVAASGVYTRAEGLTQTHAFHFCVPRGYHIIVTYTFNQWNHPTVHSPYAYGMYSTIYSRHPKVHHRISMSPWWEVFGLAEVTISSSGPFGLYGTEMATALAPCSTGPSNSLPIGGLWEDLAPWEDVFHSYNTDKSLCS